MKRNAFLLVLFAGVVALAGWRIASSGPSDEAAAPTAGTTVSANRIAPAPQAGYMVHFDENGQVVEQPVNGISPELDAALTQALNTSSEGLVQETSPIPGGGVHIELQGRFQTTSTATVDANGKLNAPCLTSEADARAFIQAASDAAKKE